MCFASQRTGLLESGRFPGDLPKAEACFAVTLHLSFLACGVWGDDPRVQVGCSGERGEDALVIQQQGESPLGATIHHPFVCIVPLLIAEDESGAGFRVGLAKRNEFCWHRFPNPFARRQQQAACSPAEVKRGINPPQALKPGPRCSRTCALLEALLKPC